MPLTAQAASDGRIDFPHVVALTSGTADLDPQVVRDGEPQLVDAASRLDPLRTKYVVAHFRHLVAPDAADNDARHAREGRWLDVARTLHDTVAIQGMLDPEAGEVVLTAINALGRPTGGADSRSAAQRRADALVDICRHALDAGMLPESAGERPHVSVLIDWQMLQSAAGVGQFAGGQPLDSGTIRRICCDAQISRVITNGASEILDLGRKTRVVSPAQKRALAIRDRGCVFEGCDVPPGWCDAHHLIHWADGGPTDLTNLALLCGYHHTVIHDHDCRTERREDGRIQIRPPPRSMPAENAVDR